MEEEKEEKEEDPLVKILISYSPLCVSILHIRIGAVSSQLPDGAFLPSRASKFADRQLLCSLKTSIRGSCPLKYSVG